VQTPAEAAIRTAPAVAVAVPGPPTVTLVEGSTFCVSALNGAIRADRAEGMFFHDMRVVSQWDLALDGEPVEPITAYTAEPFRGIFIGRAHDGTSDGGGGDSHVLVERQRLIGDGLREDIVVHNVSREPAECTVAVEFAADFADLFEVKNGHVTRHWEHTSTIGGRELVIEAQWHNRRHGVVIHSSRECTIEHRRLTYKIRVPARGQWSTTVLVQPVLNGVRQPTAFPLDLPLADTEPMRRLLQWRMQSSIARSDHSGLELALRRSQQDLGALRMSDPQFPGRAVVAAGAPWYMALFGRDSLLSAFMALPIDQDLAHGTLDVLARYQGERVDPITEEQPGRILHEVRLGADAGVALGGGGRYYGTVDATPLFVILLAELRRWSGANREIDMLIPNADRALRWVVDFGDRDHDGFVEYARSTEHGLVNQGWKDSWNGINFADGRLAQAPIALCEVQGYVYAAYLARAAIAQDAGDRDGFQTWSSAAEALKVRFNEQFWLPDRGYYAIALDHEKVPVDACASNMGHCLWTGIIDERNAGSVAEHLMSEQMFSGWGVRTLASNMGLYNPVSYHNGSVWPHDNAIIAAGLMRYGFVEEAHRITAGLLDAAERFEGRLPELFCGFSREDHATPVPYPRACSPQAWAAATPVHLVRTMLRFDPQVPQGIISLAPVLPRDFGRLHMQNILIAGHYVSIDAAADRAHITGLPTGLGLVQEPATGS
jgi:glycogen debranching enzyme